RAGQSARHLVPPRDDRRLPVPRTVPRHRARGRVGDSRHPSAARIHPVRQAGPMKLYSDFARRRTLQILADLTAVVLIALSIWAAVLVHAAIVVLAGIGKNL